jgi:cyclic-di-GMP phosphodiesterase TipF (flagellum assembly factor)
MSRIVVTIAITLCLLIVAVAAALTAQRLAGLDTSATVVVGIGVLLVLHVIQTAYQRIRDQAEFRRRMDDLTRVEDEFARPIQELTARVVGLEQANLARPKVDTDHLMNEVDVLGTLVKHLAESVAEVDQRVDKLTGPMEQVTSEAHAQAVRAQAERATAAQLELSERVRRAVETESIEIHLQPIVTLPQRRTRFYEALARLRDEAGDLIMPSEFIPVAVQASLMPKIDNMVLFRSVQLLRNLSARQKDTGLFVNLAAESLADSTFFAEFSGFMQANRALADQIIFEVSQQAFIAFGPMEQESIGAIAGMGFRLSLDRVSDLKADFKKLAERGFRFVKVAAPTLLRRSARLAPDIAPTDMSDMLARFGIDLISDHIETEAEVIDLLDYDIRLGQGNLFAPPRAVRAEAINRARTETPMMAAT